MTDKIEKYFCNQCQGKTNHFIRAEYDRTDDDGEFWLKRHLLIVECCGCETPALVYRSLFSEHRAYWGDPKTGELIEEGWDEVIYPPVSYRRIPAWYSDLPDTTLQDILQEIYKSLQTESHYLATFGSRTLIDRLIVLTVGDQGNFYRGLKALEDAGKISSHEMEIMKPIVEAGNAAAHRAWVPTKELLWTILDTVEGLIHRLLVQPKLSEELDEAVPARGNKKSKKPVRKVPTAQEKISAAPNALRKLYDRLADRLKSFGSDVTVHPQKHYIAFRRKRNFASVQIYNQKKLLRAYLNIEPESVLLEEGFTRDVRQIGHFGTGDLEVTIASNDDIERAVELIRSSYDAS